MKKGSRTCDALAAGRPVAMLHLQGRYRPGETAEQWRGEGVCEKIPLEEMLDILPHYTMTGMIGSKRIEKEKGELVKELSENVSGVSRTEAFFIAFGEVQRCSNPLLFSPRITS